jgi:hypothetical protein
MDPTEPTGLLGWIGIANGRYRWRVSADRGWMVIGPELPLKRPCRGDVERRRWVVSGAS